MAYEQYMMQKKRGYIETLRFDIPSFLILKVIVSGLEPRHSEPQSECLLLQYRTNNDCHTQRRYALMPANPLCFGTFCYACR